MCITLEDAPKACELLLGDAEPGDVNAAAVVLSLSRHHTSAMSVQLLHHVAAQGTKGLNSCRVLEVVDGGRCERRSLKLRGENYGHKRFAKSDKV